MTSYINFDPRAARAGQPAPREIVGYSLIVTRGARAGLRRNYKPAQRIAARRFADRLDQEYGAICASVHPIYSGSEHAATL